MKTQNTPIKHPSHLPTAQAVAGGVPHLDVPMLIDLAHDARQELPGISKFDLDSVSARAFVAGLVAQLHNRCGVAVADAFAAALGFEHLMSDWEVGQ